VQKSPFYDGDFFIDRTIVCAYNVDKTVDETMYSVLKNHIAGYKKADKNAGTKV